MLSFWFQTKLSHLLPLGVMLTKSVNTQPCSNRHSRIPCFCSISLCSNYQFDLFVHIDPYSPLNYPRLMFQEAPDTRRKTIADVLWNNCWPDGPKWRPWVEGCLLLEEPTSHAWELWPAPLTVGAKGCPVQLLIGFSGCLLTISTGYSEVCSVSLSNLTLRTRSVWGKLEVTLELRKQQQQHTHKHRLHFSFSNVLWVHGHRCHGKPSLFMNEQEGFQNHRCEMRNCLRSTEPLPPVVGLQAPANESDGLLFYRKAHKYLSFTSCQKSRIHRIVIWN